MTEKRTEKMPPIASPFGDKPMLTGPKRHHYLPEFYLHGFCRDDSFAVYDRTENSINPRTPVNTAVIGHYYTLKDDEGRKRYELEHMLSQMEGEAAGVIKKLENREGLTSHERESFSLFMAFANFRTPDMVESIGGVHSSIIKMIAQSSFSDVEEVVQHLAAKRGSNDPAELRDEAEQLVDFATKGEFNVRMNEKWLIGESLRSAVNVAPMLQMRKWSIVHRSSERHSFVTTDAPVILTSSSPDQSGFWGTGFGTSDAVIMMPLSQRCMIVLFGLGESLHHVSADSSMIRRLNLQVVSRCKRYVIGRDEAHVRGLVERTKLADRGWQSKFKMS